MLGHIIAWTLFIFYPFILLNIEILDPSFIIKLAINGLSLAAVFYLNLYVLIPRFYARKKFGVYFAFAFLLLLFVVIEEMYTQHLFFSQHHTGRMVFKVNREMPPGTIRPAFKLGDSTVVSNDSSLFISRSSPKRGDSNMVRNDSSFLVFRSTPSPFNKKFMPWQRFYPVTLRRSLPSALIVLMLSGFLRMSREWNMLDKQRKDLEKSKLDAELSLLKSQINPHFLFNTLNTIYSLAHKKSVNTEAAILKLSQLMRYMIYDSSVEFVPLSHEIEYLRNYVELQQYRLSGKVSIGFDVKGENKGLMIAPMLLIVFVENAFKHGISYMNPSAIKIRLTVNNKEIEFEVTNMLHSEIQKNNYKGIGLENIKKRLALIYPGRHEINVHKDDKIYSAYLKIQT